MSSAPTLEQQLSINTNFDPPQFSLDNTFKAFLVTHIFCNIDTTELENNFNIFSFVYTYYIYVEKSNYFTSINFHRYYNKKFKKGFKFEPEVKDFTSGSNITPRDPVSNRKVVLYITSNLTRFSNLPSTQWCQ